MEKKDIDKKLLLLYGTLRKNAKPNWNYNRFGPQTWVSDMRLDGYQIYSLGSYPAACIGVGSIFVELHEVYPKTYDMITKMEQGAGYEVHGIRVKHPTKGDQMASLYAMPWTVLASICRGRILSGDWNFPATTTPVPQT